MGRQVTKLLAPIGCLQFHGLSNVLRPCQTLRKTEAVSDIAASDVDSLAVERYGALASRDDEILSFLCECADDFCVDQVVLQLARYGEIRDSSGYVLAPGHRPRLTSVK